MGDGVLVEFGSAVFAVQCAVDLQRRMDEANAGLADDRRILLRIGINLGDVVVEGGDLYGDGVILAVQIQAMAGPGDILIARTVHEQIEKKLAIFCEDLGPLDIKNMTKKVRVYRVSRECEPTRTPPPELPLPAKPSIAVLPFTTMSGDPEHESFADGLVEDLITDLSQAPGLFVIARNSSFAYKGKLTDARTIARELGVRYLLEGSARRAADRVRINVQLIDAAAHGHHLWAERFDRRLDDIFSVQDEVTARIVDALVGRLTVHALPRRNRPANIEAYDLCVRGRLLIAQSPQAALEARRLLEQSIALDPSYAEPHCLLAFNLLIAWMHWGEPMEPTRHLAVVTAEKAVALDPNYAGARWILGSILSYERRWEEAEAQFEEALR